MEGAADFVKEFLLPGSLSFLLLGLTLGVLALFGKRRLRDWGRAWLTMLAAGYWLMSTPLVAAGLEAALGRQFEPIAGPEQLEGVGAIVVLGGGSVTHRAPGGELQLLSRSSALRAIETIRLYRWMDEPWVIASGGGQETGRSGSAESQAMRQALIMLGVPAERVLVEGVSRNTRDQALKVEPMLVALGVERFVLVTSPTHMPRALGAFRAVGLEPIPAVSAQHSETVPMPSFALQPDLEALDASKVAVREFIALAYYWLRGWLGGP